MPVQSNWHFCHSPHRLYPIPLSFFLFIQKSFIYKPNKDIWSQPKVGSGLGEVSIQEKVCEMCKQKFHLQDHQCGLVFDDKFFICEDCRTNTPEQDIMDWSQSTMHQSTSAMPISLWLIQEQNKNKPLFSKRKDWLIITRCSQVELYQNPFL